MKVVVTADGGFMTSKYNPSFEGAPYLIIYDLEDRFFGARESPSFQTKDRAILIDFLKKTFMKKLITSTEVGDEHFEVYKPKNTDATVEEVLIEYISTLS